jgi:hypothetical protein
MGDLGVDEREILNCMFKYGVWRWARFKWIRIETSAGFREHVNEPSDCTQGWKFLDQLRDCQFLKDDLAALSKLLDKLS